MKNNPCGRLDCARLCTSDGARAAYAAHAGELLGFCQRALQDRATAEDVVQEVLLRAWRNCHAFRPDAGTLRTWLFAIARNAVVDAARALHRTHLRLVPDTDLAEMVAVADDDESVAEWPRLARAIVGLTPVHRAVIVGFYLRQQSYEELASEADVPVGTIKSRLHYGMHVLRASLTAPRTVQTSDPTRSWALRG